MTNPDRPLRPEHAEHLAQFKIPDHILRAAGARSVTNIETREILGLNGYFHGEDLGGILLPSLDPITKTRNGGRVRLDHPLQDGKQKYVSEPGCRHFCFAPCDAKDLRDRNIPVVFVEAEKSALASLSH